MGSNDYLRIDVDIEEPDRTKEDAIRAATAQFDFRPSDWEGSIRNYVVPRPESECPYKFACRITHIGLGGEHEERRWATDLTHAIWRANGAYCEVTVSIDICMIGDNYTLSEEDYARFSLNADQHG